MVRVAGRIWTPEQISTLLALVKKGVSPVRASIILGRPKQAVQNKARQLGKPFRDVREVKAARLAREASQVQAASVEACQLRPGPSPRRERWPTNRLSFDIRSAR
jgi:hypothetical protein